MLAFIQLHGLFFAMFITSFLIVALSGFVIFLLAWLVSRKLNNKARIVSLSGLAGFFSGSVLGLRYFEMISYGDKIVHHKARFGILADNSSFVLIPFFALVALGMMVFVFRDLNRR